MGKVLKTALTVVAVVASIAAAIPTFGASLGISAALLSGIALASTLGASLLSAKPKSPSASSAAQNRLQVSINLRAPRTIVFGRTAMNTDLRDQEWSADQTYLHRFVVAASHKVSSIEEIWFDDKQAWTSAGGVQGTFAGYLQVDTILEGSAANAINISARMGSSRRYTGCAYVHFRYKLTGNSSKTDSPFAQSIPTRVTIIGKGAPVYDPRKDSTVGGSGSQRANDQTTWAWDDDAARNPVLQALWYELGWRIQNPSTGAWKLAVGKGIPAARLNLASYIDAANLCDEAVAKAAGGTEPRYRSDGVFSEGDDPSTVRDNLKAACNATLDDVDGKIRITVLHNDLAAPIGSLGTDDVLGAFTWTQTPPLDQTVNVIRGGYTDPSTTSLYQLTDYPEVRYDSPDGIDRPQTVDLHLVQSPSQAQRLVKLRLQRAVFGGTFEAVFQATAWRFQKGDVIRLSFTPLGWSNKLFRIAETSVQVDGTVPMLLREEDPAIYAWDTSDAPAVVGVVPTTYNSTLGPVAAAIADASATATWPNIINRPANVAALTGSEGIQNTAITQNADFTISGAGGGGGTLAGLQTRVGTVLDNGAFAVVSGKLYTGVGTLSPIVDNGYIVVSAGKLSRDGGATTVGPNIDNTGLSLTQSGNDISLSGGGAGATVNAPALGVAPGATSDIVLVAGGNVSPKINGNTVTGNGSDDSNFTGWAATRNPISGPAIVTAMLGSQSFLGLSPNASPTNGASTYTVMPLSVLRGNNGHWYTFASGAYRADLGTGFDASTEWGSGYDGSSIFITANGPGNVVDRIPYTATGPLYGAVSVTNSAVTGFACYAYADVTANQTPSYTGNPNFAMDADSAGNVTTTLPLTRQFRAFQGTTDVTTATAWALSGIVPSGAASAVSVDNTTTKGLFSSSAAVAFTATLTGTLPNGSKVVIPIVVTKTNAPIAATGGSGASSATITALSPTSSTSYAVGSSEVVVRSDSAGKVRVTFDITCGGTGTLLTGRTAGVKLSYATSSGGTPTDIVGEQSSGNYVPNDDYGYIGYGEVQVTMPAASTDYYFKAQVRKVSGAGTVTFPSATITVRQ